MSQMKKFAIGYVLAVPVGLAIVFIQIVSITGTSGAAGDMSETSSVIVEMGRVLALLKAAEANVQTFSASGGKSSSVEDYRNSVSELQATLQRIHEQTDDEQSLQAKFQTLRDLISRQVSLFDQELAAGREKITAQNKTTPVVKMQQLMEDISKAVMEINSVEKVRIEKQSEISRRSLRRAKLLATYGGGVMIWLIGVAAFLLFYKERIRVWAGVERRVHTIILQALPLGVSVATDSGAIIFSNPAEEALLGYESGELLDKHADLLHDLQGPEGERVIHAILERLGTGHAWNGELPVRRKDGTIRLIPSWIVNLPVPGKVYRVFVHRGGDV